MQTVTEKRYYTPEEYLELEDKAEYKSEYRDGEIIPMTGGTTNQNKIAGNFYSNLKFALKGQSFDVFIGDVRLWIPRYRQYTYPDVMIIQGEPVYYGKGTTTVSNPIMIMEVLSKSTQDYDRGEKFKYYRSIPEFKEYILIDQYSFYLEQFSKNPSGKWVLTEYELEDAVLALESINLEVLFSDIYERVNFELNENE
ncbi:MAG: Uma2 family endonuclease [Nostocaceae cyanobacterium]|nr:Uma2 family endonuclease [Nostocaceae cyanobacterium]